MSKILELTQQTTLGSVGTADKLYVESGGTLRPVTLDVLAKAVRDTIKVGGRNLLLDSDEPKTGTYGLGKYQLSEPWEIGKEYVMTLYGVTIGEGKNNEVQVWDEGGYHCLFRCYPQPDGTYRGVFKPSASADISRAGFLGYHIFPQSVTTVSTIMRAKFEEGNIPTAWSPAPEDLESAKSGGGVIQFTLYADSRSQEGGLRYECNEGINHRYTEAYSCGCYGLSRSCDCALGGTDRTWHLSNFGCNPGIGIKLLLGRRKHTSACPIGSYETRGSGYNPSYHEYRVREYRAEYVHQGEPSRHMEVMVYGGSHTAHLIAVKRRKEVAYV